MRKDTFAADAARRARIEQAIANSTDDEVLDLYWEYFRDIQEENGYSWEIYDMEMVDYMFDELEGLDDDERREFLAEEGIDERHKYWCFPDGSSDSLVKLMHGYDWWIDDMVESGCDVVEEVTEDGSRKYSVVRDETPDDVTLVCIE